MVDNKLKELEGRMTPEQLKKMRIHYGMGVEGNIGFADNYKRTICQICLLNEHCQHNFDFECEEAN